MDVKKRRKEKNNYRGMKADAATNFNHSSVSKNIHTVSKFTLHSHDEKFSNTWCVNVNINAIHMHKIYTGMYLYIYVNILRYVKRATSKVTVYSHEFYRQGYFSIDISIFLILVE